MSRSINKAVIVGYLGKDPEVRYMPSGGAVANVTIATTESWKDKQSGEQKDRTEWHSIVFYNRLAEIAGEYLRKGSQVYVEGSLRTRKWQDKNGQDRYTTEIVGSEMLMLGGRGGAGGGYDNAPQQQGGYNQAPQQQHGGYNQNQPSQQQGGGYNNNQPTQQSPQQGGDFGGFDDFYDDIPF